MGKAYCAWKTVVNGKDSITLENVHTLSRQSECTANLQLVITMKEWSVSIYGKSPHF